MTTPPPDPSILSPYGEGYCRYCHFVVGLSASGYLERHTRGASVYTGERLTCPGSVTTPPKKIPYASRKAAFRAIPDRRVCSVCGREVATLNGVLTGHRNQVGTGPWCTGGGRKV